MSPRVRSLTPTMLMAFLGSSWIVLLNSLRLHRPECESIVALLFALWQAISPLWVCFIMSKRRALASWSGPEGKWGRVHSTLALVLHLLDTLKWVSIGMAVTRIWKMMPEMREVKGCWEKGHSLPFIEGCATHCPQTKASGSASHERSLTGKQT